MKFAPAIVLAMVRARGACVDYLPVVSPGFSWANLVPAHGNAVRASPNQIPRRCGAFVGYQLDNVVAGSRRAANVAMFDEVDGGIAIFKVQPHATPRSGLGPFLASK